MPEWTDIITVLTTRGGCLAKGQMQMHADSGKWLIGCPRCGRVAMLSTHVVEFKEGKPTISPSLICPREECAAHYWVTDGDVKRC